MPTVLTVYASDYGHTRDAAMALTEGADRVRGVDARHATADSLTHDDVAVADALVLGSPVHMGSMHWEMKRFVDLVLGRFWSGAVMRGRIGGVFVTGGGVGGAGGGCELTMLSLHGAMAELGMHLIPLARDTPGFEHGGLHWGPYVRCATSTGAAHPVPNECRDLLAGHGAAIAQAAVDRSIARRFPALHLSDRSA